MTTSAADLRMLISTWPDLNAALGMPATIGGFGRGLRAYLTLADALDPEEIEAMRHQRTACRFLEQDAHLLGQRPIPIRLTVYATMRTIEAALTGCAAAVAEHVQRTPIPMPAPRRAAYAKTRADRVAWDDHARRVQAAQDDAADPRRWKWTGTQPTAPYTALWLLARVEGRPGPFRPLAPAQKQHVAHVAREARHRIEQTLDTGTEEAKLAKPCPATLDNGQPCGGIITVHGGAGSSPLANCKDCGGIWTELGAAA